MLLIEDEAEIADFIVRGLREEGFTTELATDGHDGWHRLSTESWDVILLDWWLPGWTGCRSCDASGSPGARRRCCS